MCVSLSLSLSLSLYIYITRSPRTQDAAPALRDVVPEQANVVERSLSPKRQQEIAAEFNLDTPLLTSTAEEGMDMSGVLRLSRQVWGFLMSEVPL